MMRDCCIIAMDAITALGAGLDETWGRMLLRETGIRPMQRFPRGKYATDVAAEIPDDAAASGGFDIGDGRSRCYALASGVAANALSRAGVCAARTGLVLSTTKAEIGELERSVAAGRPLGRGRFLPHRMARDLAADLQLGGPVAAVSNACASGLAALVQAARMLERGDADAVLVAGADVLADFTLAGFSCLGALSPRPCRPYDASRDGLSLGEAAAAMVLVRGDDAAGRALAAVTGWAITNDANHITSPLCTGDGLRASIEQALRRARLAPSEIDFVNGHGTGTIQNDEMEAQALHSVFGNRTPPVSSFKGYIGHTLGAAGLVEAALCVRAMQASTVPASLGFSRLGVSGPINVAADHLDPARVAHVLTLKCGFGGINAAVILSMAGHQ